MSTTPPAVVEAGDFTYDSNKSSAAEMIRALKPSDPKDPAPREIKRGPRGETKAEAKSDPVSDAASTLGKKGAEAAAEARKLKAKAGAKDPKGPGVELDEAALKDAKDRADEKAAKGKTEGDEEDDADEGDEAAAERKSRSAERVKQATREAAEAKRETARLKAENEQLRREREERTARPATREDAPAATKEPAQARPAAQDDPKPDLSTYEGEDAYERFVEDTSRWAARDEHRKVATRQREADGHREAVKTITAHVETFHERLTGLPKGETGSEAQRAQAAAFSEFMDTLPDELQAPTSVQVRAYAIATKQPHIQSGPENLITDLIVKSPVPGEFFRHFADDMDDYRRVKALGEPDAIKYAMAKIEARLEDATAGNPSSDERPGSSPEISKARPPARPVAVSPRIANAEPGADSSLDDHIEFYDARDREKRRRRA